MISQRLARISITVVSTVLLALGAATANAGTAQPGQASPLPPNAPGSDGQRLLAIQHLQDLVDANPSGFAGMLSTGDSNGPQAVSLHLVGVPGQATDISQISSTATVPAIHDVENAGVTVTIDQQAHSIQYLQTLLNSVPSVLADQVKAGVVQSWGIDSNANSVEIDVYTASPKIAGSVSPTEAAGSAVAAIQSAFAGKPVTVKSTDSVGHPAGRFDDTPPFYGGDQIVSDTNVSCASGFAITDGNGKNWTMTAGHCGKENQGFRTPASAFFGILHLSYLYSHNLDSALINADHYAGQVWTNGVNTSSHIRVTGAVNSCIGCVVFVDAYQHGQVAVTVSGQSTCTTYPGIPWTACDTQKAYSTSTATPCSDGDSGAPVFAALTNGTVYAIGIVEGCGFDGSKPWVIYTQIPSILVAYNSTIDTSLT